ncbi:peptidylprolyl isomerase [Sandarakinorhabdus rubra]|uniref:peptidylprolyl isomerase n=1 Tax=Sandarakinorhabdus rubra TaxID=2672568 RepID=UPI0013D90375|nr:peptidylprolyl isomerase [Sandarakinorhabdus rubra]
MIRRTLLVSLVLFALPAAAQETPPAPPAAPATVDVVMETGEGRIVIALDTTRAPVTAGYILRHVDEKRLDGAAFYRAYKVTPDGSIGLVQGGIQDGRKLLPPVAHEPTTTTGLTHDEGAISLARGAPGTAQAQFFIILGNLKALDADPAAAGDNLGYAVFGRVIEGMDVVRRILNVPLSLTKGEGAMKGQMIETPVPITTVRRVIPLPPNPVPKAAPKKPTSRRR